VPLWTETACRFPPKPPAGLNRNRLSETPKFAHRRLSDHAVHLLLAGDIGCEGNDAPVRLGSQLSRRRLQIPLVPRHDRHIDPFASQFPRYGFANAPTAASHDRMLALQSEVHGTLSPWLRDRNFIASLLVVLS
jgi:hypothetical protein